MDSGQKVVRLTNGSLRFRVSYDRRCLIDSLWIGSTVIAGAKNGSHTGLRIDSAWYTSQRLVAVPHVSASGDSVQIRDILYAAGQDTIAERWSFSLRPEGVVWTIDRTLSRALVLEENAFPLIQTDSISSFDGALLGNGGGAWFRLFNDSRIAYGVHTDEATLWSLHGRRCVQVTSQADRGESALALSRTGEVLGLMFSRSPAELIPRFDAGTHRRRFIRGRTDVWGAARYPAGTYRQVLTLSVPEFNDRIGRGEFKGVDGDAITAIMNTTARLGVIDAKLFGGNSWHTPYGPICIHEQYIAQFGIGINDENYIRGYMECLDYYRDHAIQSDGRIKARWAYTNEDALPGTADSLGFYEAQWGIMMDSQADFAINVAELFDQCGDVQWLRRHKQSTENVLAYLLRRDADRDSLVEVMTESHKEGRGSDWLDVIWASWESAFVNAVTYRALTLWSDLEQLMGDTAKASSYSTFAAALKTRYNKSTRDGGFWDEDHGWYVHWREKDDAIYGDNLVTPVNFMAIAYGLCDDPTRKMSILHTIETETQREGLFFWPICVFPYPAGLGLHVNYPYPSYENGDLFLSWGEVGVAAYADDLPEVALRYVKNVIQRYTQDGLAYQRYLRATQQGSGDDILAGNASAITGLYKNLYGIQPRYDRLMLRPRLVKELYGTQLRYTFRQKRYQIALNAAQTSVTVDGATVSASGDFGILRDGSRMVWYHDAHPSPALVVSSSEKSAYSVAIQDWSSRRLWTERSFSGPQSISHEVNGLQPNQDYAVMCDGYLREVLNSGNPGRIVFSYAHDGRGEHMFEVKPLPLPERLRGKPVLSLEPPVITPGDSILFLPGSVLIRLTHDTPGAVIRYTLDGNDPTDRSAEYTAPLRVDASTVVKARAFRSGAEESAVATTTYTILPADFQGIAESGKSIRAFHKGLHKTVSLRRPYSSKYAASGPGALTDGVLGTENFTLNWQGFEQDDLEATIDLGKPVSIDSIRAGFLQDLGLWIFPPVKVEMYFSKDGNHFEPLGPVRNVERHYRSGQVRYECVYSGRRVAARYVRVFAKNQGVCPPGHPGAGGKAWLFVDEIMIQ